MPDTGDLIRQHSKQDQALTIQNESCLYRDKQGIKGLPPLSPAPQIPAEAPPLRSGTNLRSTQHDEAKHFYAQSTRQRRCAPTAVRLHGNTVRFPLESPFTFTGIPSCRQSGPRRRLLAVD
jgi:hypothetical protein